MKKCLFILAAMLALALTACGTTAAEPSAAPEQEPSAESPAGEISLVRLSNDENGDAVILADYQPVARGEVSLVTDQISHRPVGYTVGTPGPDAISYTIYHPDGSLWYDAGDCHVRGTAGRWLILADGSDFEEASLIFVDPTTGERRDTGCSVFGAISEDRWLLSGWEYDSDSPAPSIVDAGLNVVHTFEGFRGGWYSMYGEDGPGYISLTDSAGGDYRTAYADPVTYEILPVSDIWQINDGWCVYEHEGCLFDVVSPDGTVVESGIPQHYRYYSDTVQFGELNDDYFLTVNGETEWLPGWCEFESWAGGYYLSHSSDPAFLRVYDNDGNMTSLVEGAPGESFSAYAAGELLLVEQNDSYALYNAAGELLRVEPKNDSTFMWISPLDDSRVVMNRYGSAPNGRWQDSYSLLDRDGTLIKDHFNYLRDTDEKGVYQARRGFTFGLVDSEGNWLWSESVFNSVDDEAGEIW